MRYILSLFLILCSTCYSGDKLILNGYLGSDEVGKIQNSFKNLVESHPQEPLILDIDSSSGDLSRVLELAKELYEYKTLHKLKIVVYLHDSVVGPSAILPFLADELYSSLSLSWGDIPLGTEKALPTNILRNRVRSLIDPRDPHAQTLYVLADAMTDPSLQVVVEGKGWALAQEKETKRTLVSAQGQTLVVNQNQLSDLGIVKAILTPEQFDQRFQIALPTVNKETPQSSLKASLGFEELLKKSIHINPEGPNRIGHLYVGDHQDSINESTWLYIKQGLEYYKKNPPDFIILELDTPGGEVFAAQKISDALKEMDTQFNVPVVAFINNWAISAGAMLAYSCRFITTVKDGSMGAATPVIMGESGKMEEASEKVNSAIRADFASRAQFFDRNPYIAEAMVDKDVILVRRYGKIIKLDNESQIRKEGPEVDVVISPKGKLLTLNGAQMFDYGVANFLFSPAKLEPKTALEEEQGRWPLSKTLLSQVPFFAAIPNAMVDVYRMDWKTRFFVFLATPLISSLLFMGLIVGGYMELNNPGLTLPGAIAGTCLFLLILSHFALQLGNWLELIILLTGLILILVELFVLPTFGFLGFVGIFMFIGGLFAILLPEIKSVEFQPDTGTLNAAGQYFLEQLGWLMGSLFVSIFIITLLARFVLPSFSGFNRFLLVGHEQEASRGYFAGEDPKLLPQPGERGVALATLRPAGKILIQDRIYDAVSTGGFIEAGEKIVVARLEGSVIMVNGISEDDIV